MKGIAAAIDADIIQIDIGAGTAFMCLTYHRINNKWMSISMSSQ